MSMVERDRADYLARCFVNGMRMHGRSRKMEPASGEFAERFSVHPWVRESVMEGWGKELRGHLIYVVRRRIMLGERYDMINDLMPPKEWVENAKANAIRYASARKWQEANIPINVGLSALLVALAKQNNIAYDPITGEIGDRTDGVTSEVSA